MGTKEEELTHETLLEALLYNPEDGKFIWRHSRPVSHFKTPVARKIYLSKFAGKEAGHNYHLKGTQLTYVQIRLNSVLYLAHRLAWFYVHKEWPSVLVDHKDGVGTNNRLENLREVGYAENGRNCKLSSNNTSGVNGVYWNKVNRNWVAEGHYTEGGVNKKVSLGSFADLEDARLARESWEKSQGNFTQRHGKEERSSLLENIT